MEKIVITYKETPRHKVLNLVKVIGSKFPCFIDAHFIERKIFIEARREDVKAIKNILKFIK